MSQEPSSAEGTAREEASEPPDDRPTRDEMSARVETLEAENERLRTALAAAHRRRYRRTAIGLAAIGLVALASATAIPGLRPVLVALGATGIFGAVLTYFLTPERFVAASVGERIYGTLADNEHAIADDLDLRGQPIVIPVRGEAAPARLFVPPSDAEDEGTLSSVPDRESLSTPFVVGDPQGLAVEPTGGPLYEALTDAAGELPSTPGDIAAAAGDALVEQFELVDAVDADAEPGRVTVAVDGSAYGPVDRFDHPVASLPATALAVELDTPVAVSVDDGGEYGEWLITCRWEA